MIVNQKAHLSGCAFFLFDPSHATDKSGKVAFIKFNSDTTVEKKISAKSLNHQKK